MSEEAEIAARAGKWVVANKDWIIEQLKQIYRWVRPEPQSPDSPGILIIGPGGAGKTTLARILSGEYTTRLYETPWVYDESVAEERYTLLDDPKTEVVVPPGQHFRRPATWTEVRSDLAAGKYRGVVLVTAYGYHSLPRNAGAYKDDPRYDGSKDRFVASLLAGGREDERRTLDFLKPGLLAAGAKLWVLVLVAKQDLWWPDRKIVRDHYTSGDWGAEFTALQAGRGADKLRVELAFASLVIANYIDGEGTRLQQNTAGYDQQLQTEYLLRLLAVIDGLREWENQS